MQVAQLARAPAASRDFTVPTGIEIRREDLGARQPFEVRELEHLALIAAELVRARPAPGRGRGSLRSRSSTTTSSPASPALRETRGGFLEVEGSRAHTNSQPGTNPTALRIEVLRALARPPGTRRVGDPRPRAARARYAPRAPSRTPAWRSYSWASGRTVPARPSPRPARRPRRRRPGHPREDGSTALAGSARVVIARGAVARCRASRGDRAHLVAGRHARARSPGRSAAASRRRARARGPRPGPADAVRRSCSIPTRGEWECDCPSKEAVCSHVVAAVIATEQADGALPTSASRGAPMRYLLEPDPGGVTVERVLVHGDRTEPLAGVADVARSRRARRRRSRRIEADLARRSDCSACAPARSAASGSIACSTVLADARDVRWRGDAGHDQRRAGDAARDRRGCAATACACGSRPIRRSPRSSRSASCARIDERAAADRRGRSRRRRGSRSCRSRSTCRAPRSPS